METDMTSETDARRAMAHIFNATVAAPAIGAAWELGALDELRSEQKLDTVAFATANSLNVNATDAMFRALASIDVVERDGPMVTPGPLFDEAWRTRSFFHWLTQGSGEVFRRMPAILPEAGRTGDFYTRDAAAISFACREINGNFYDPTFWQAMEALDIEFSVVADLGSGSGERLRQIIGRYPGTTAIGLDIAPAAVAFAEAEFARTGLDGRGTFVQADVRDLAPQPDFAAVELLTCFMMGHDFWPRENCVRTLRRLRAAFPNVRRFLLGDTTRTDYLPETETPIFTLGFEVGHALMGVYLPTIPEWQSVFTAGGWRIERTHFFETLAASVIFELSPLGDEPEEIRP